MNTRAEAFEGDLPPLEVALPDMSARANGDREFDAYARSERRYFSEMAVLFALMLFVLLAIGSLLFAN